MDFRNIGRKFRRSVDTHLLLNELETALATAGDVNECWKTIFVSSSKFGFTGVRMSLNGLVFEQFQKHGSAKLWQMRIPLGDSYYINFFRDCAFEKDALVLNAFADAVERGLRACPLWNFGAPSPERAYTAMAVQIEHGAGVTS